ncbi:MAG: YjfI family protein, partial [Giesbergeria sp.]
VVPPSFKRENMSSLLNQLEGLDLLTSQIMGGLVVDLQPITGEVPVVQVSIEGRQELPIFITQAQSQIMCLCYLWTEAEVKPDRRSEMLETLLDLNPSVPLSNFGRVGERYVLVGALSRHASVQDIATEVAVLSDNALDALGALQEFLI